MVRQAKRLYGGIAFALGVIFFVAGVATYSYMFVDWKQSSPTYGMEIRPYDEYTWPLLIAGLALIFIGAVSGGLEYWGLEFRKSG